MFFLKETLNETIFIAQPEGFTNPSKPTHVCKLRKALYGLKQAPKAWYDTLKNFLLASGFQHSVADHCLLYKNEHGKQILMLVYVDDILITGDDQLHIAQLIANLNHKFSLKHLGEVNYFLGIEAQTAPRFIKLTQTKYIKDLLKRTNLTHNKPCPTPSCPSQKLSLADSPPFSDPSLFRSIVEAFQYYSHSS